MKISLYAVPGRETAFLFLFCFCFVLFCFVFCFCYVVFVLFCFCFVLFCFVVFFCCCCFVLFFFLGVKLSYEDSSSFKRHPGCKDRISMYIHVYITCRKGKRPEVCKALIMGWQRPFLSCKERIILRVTLCQI